MAERLRRREEGFTLIELLVAVGILAVGVIVLIGTFDYSRRLTSTSEQSDVAAHQAEAEMERILALGYKGAALTAPPAKSADPSNPDYYVQPGGEYQWDQSGPQPAESLWVDPAQGDVTHVSSWSDDQSRLSGHLYDYVTLVPDPSAPDPNSPDPKKHPAKRITVAVTVDSGPGDLDNKKPVLATSIVIDPKGG